MAYGPDSPVSVLKGVGSVRLKQLEKLNIRTLGDLVSHFPRTYEDRTKIVQICDMEVDVPACFRATVISYPRTARLPGGRNLTKVVVSDMTAKLTLNFFNRPYLDKQLRYGQDYVFFGVLREGFGLSITNPEFDTSGARSTGRILPIYPLTAGLTNHTLTGYIEQALTVCLPQMEDILPQDVREQYDLCDAQFAYRCIHAPDNFGDLARARRRLVFEEFFVFSAGLAVLRASRGTQHAAPWTDLDLSPLYKALPYSLTGAQQRAVDQISADVSSGSVMHRLVQGDVGSGKTVVAAAAAYLAHRAGKQTALMAPTEILAEQHATSLGKLLGGLGLEVVLLTGALGAAEKRWVKERISGGQADVVIGTHALLTADVEFSNLGLVVTDEQHRFGVRQRAALADKAEQPHTLFLSATPIPRTLALILYGDLDVSVMDEMPPGRQPIDTYLVDETMRKRINAFIRKQVEAGNQVYVVCPAVEENEETELKSAEAWYAQLQNETFPDLRVGLLHGKMKGADKDAVMRAFSAHELDILVATTVIEVGVDVPNATLMVVEDADRFGLSQLHQLRGRVGRGAGKSYCVLFSESKKPETLSRLNALCATQDGFRIAEQDLALRGPGDFFGDRQHGLPEFHVADLEVDVKTMQQAQEASQSLRSAAIADDPQYAPLLRRIKALFNDDTNRFN
ncbi:MAG: ATP-dependent DNA helicase RecG [Oscillospiraceae bacterium]|nr:ATP-dependent DNA helicase RecG [Oscillospiraceae bacterium]